MPIDIERAFARLQFGDVPRLRFYRKVAKMLGNGLPLLRIIDELRERAAARGGKRDAMVIICDDCRRMLQNGRMLSEALQPWIPQNEQMIILAGEQSGRLEHTLYVLIEVAQAGKKIRRVVVGGLAYPAALFGLTLAYVYVFGTQVVPQFAMLVDPAKWQGVAASLYWMSQAVRHWTLPVLAGLGALAALVVFSLPRWRGSLRALADRVAPWSIYRLLAGGSFLLAFSALQGAGISVEKSLMRLSDAASPWLRERLDGALMGVKSGLNCGEALRNAGYGFPSQEVIDDLCVYADYKGFTEALATLAQEWMEEGVEAIAGQMKVLNGLAILTLSLVMGWLVTGFFGLQQEITALTRAVH
ncbi:type II secretion system F family protein [Massilia sp. CFBP9012]|jgi:type II secretory pathway component PulF|uniref:type II secretion system F family protein n=1 Tax=Massilia sp. CFBP9012 TaxID=3096531 RepID=UPI002A6B3EF6|nr:type II secretion system F family protein [Massilia sp. CFBP9012]MDY0977760.1 type II secretion system F family protein [Massilia sp. CFBP9012]